MCGDPYNICLLICLAKLETSHVLQSNKSKSYRGRSDRLSVSIFQKNNFTKIPENNYLGSIRRRDPNSCLLEHSTNAPSRQKLFWGRRIFFNGFALSQSFDLESKRTDPNRIFLLDPFQKR